MTRLRSWLPTIYLIIHFIRENGGAWKRLCQEVLNMAVTLAVIAGFFLVSTVLMGDVPLD